LGGLESVQFARFTTTPTSHARRRNLQEADRGFHDVEPIGTEEIDVISVYLIELRYQGMTLRQSFNLELAYSSSDAALSFIAYSSSRELPPLASLHAPVAHAGTFAIEVATAASPIPVQFVNRACAIKPVEPVSGLAAPSSATHQPARRSCWVGWVERSETYHFPDYAALHPGYAIQRLAIASL